MGPPFLCIDPGPKSSGVCEYLPEINGVRNADSKADNNSLMLDREGLPVLIEMIASYGMPVGASVFETCGYIGRLVQHYGPDNCLLIYRKDVKLTLCNSLRAKDANVRQALLDRFPAYGGGKTPQVGTKNDQGPLYGVTSHAWSALALGVAYAENPSIGRRPNF